jgi:hypothetical protein
VDQVGNLVHCFELGRAYPTKAVVDLVSPVLGLLLFALLLIIGLGVNIRAAACAI